MIYNSFPRALINIRAQQDFTWIVREHLYWPHKKIIKFCWYSFILFKKQLQIILQIGHIYVLNLHSLINCNLQQRKSAVIIHTFSVIIIDVDECKSNSTPNICGENAVCTNTNGSYYCHCKSGFTPTHNFTQLNGTKCQGKESLM